MNILFVITECVPFVKTGGLADVGGALPQALAALGHKVHVVLPYYRQVKNTAPGPREQNLRLLIPMGSENVAASVWETRTAETDPVIHFLQYDPFFDRPDLYRNVSGGYADNDRRFIFLCRGALELGKNLGLHWDVIHCHDWHTALIPVLLKTFYQDEPAFARARTLLTIHNLAYQGHFERETFPLTRLPWSVYTPEGVEFFGGINFLKAGLKYADWINTVSPTYALEIQTKEFGWGLEEVMHSRHETISGIINGLDYARWDPASDPFLSRPYDLSSMENKQEVKTSLLEKIGLYPLENAPLIGMISRLDDQKGCDLLTIAMEGLLKQNLQLIILGTGDKRYHNVFLRIKARYPRRLSLHLEFNEKMAHMIYGGADIFLMPSRYEPCGLGQMIGMRYGTIPVVRLTGGLADTVIPYPAANANGFGFKPYTVEALTHAVREAGSAFADKKTWHQCIANAMNTDFSWNRVAEAYDALYRRIVKR